MNTNKTKTHNKNDTPPHRWGLHSTILQCMALLCTIMPLSFSVQAHPHSWIDMKTRINSQNGMITGFHMEWTFDPMTSAYILEDKTKLYNDNKKTQALANQLIKNITPEHYFTYFFDKNNPIKFRTARNEKINRNKNKLTLSFELPLSTPKQPQGKELNLLVFDPTYFIDMKWVKTNDIQLSEELSSTCAITLIQPTPTQEQINQAFTIDYTKKPIITLGEAFSQTAKIHCK